MPVTKADVVRLVKAATTVGEERIELLTVAGNPSLWDGLDEEDVLPVLRKQLQQTSTGSQELHELRQEMTELRTTVDIALPFLKVAGLLFDWTEDVASASSVVGFKDDLISRYSKRRASSEGPLLYCMLTHEYLPRRVVIGSHIWKRAWWKYLELVGFDDINDPRNGLLLAKPVEWAFDTSQLCFVYDKDFGHFTAILLNPALGTISLADKTEELLQGRDIKQDVFDKVHATLAGKTFSSLEGRWLQSEFLDVDPYKRLLYIHAKRAAYRAKEEGWISEMPDIPDCCSEGPWQGRIEWLLSKMDGT